MDGAWSGVEQVVHLVSDGGGYVVAVEDDVGG